MPSTSSPDDTPVYGYQRPRVLTVPTTRLSSAGQEAIDLAAQAGLVLDPWQQFVLDQGMSEDAAGNWSAFEVAVNVPRQNGKGGIIEARELWGLFIGGEELILHSAHEFKTAKNAFKRIERLIRRCPDLHKRVKRYWQTTGEESIELHSGQMLRFIARSNGSGRGFTGHCNILDEDMILGDGAMDALMPTMAAVENPQIWYLGSAGIGAPSVQLGRLRRRAVAAMESGEPDPSLAYFEWSIDAHVAECKPECADHDDVEAPESVLKANPAVGYRLSLLKAERERLTMGPDGYARERLGVGEYPSDSEDAWQVVPEETWRALADAESRPAGKLAFAADINPERTAGSITVASRREDGRWHCEVMEHRDGIGWMVPWLLERVDTWKPCALVIDAASPAGALIPLLEAKWEKTAEETKTPRPEYQQVLRPTGRDVAQAYGQWRDAIAEGQLRYLQHPRLDAAVAGAAERKLGEAKALTRQESSVDISPLVAMTLAMWGHTMRAHIEPEEPTAPWAVYG